MTTLRESTRPAGNISPQDQRANFWHLYGDVFWFGIAFGSTLSFIAVYAARLGATAWQVGLLTAGPALVNTLFTMPAGRWLEGRPLGRAVTQAALWQRLGYFVLIPLPLLLAPVGQLWSAILLSLLIALPGTALAIGFNALLATTVPLEWRGHVVGRRNALLAGATMVSFLLSGWILDWLSFQWGYAVVFGLGALGGALSTFHVSRIRVPAVPEFQGRPLRDRAQPGRATGGLSDSLAYRTSVGMRFWLTRRLPFTGLGGRVSRKYGWVMVAYFIFHFAQLLPGPLFPLFWVNEARLSDGMIGWVNATFYLTMLLAAPLLGPLTRRLGNYRLNVVGALLLAQYPLLTALSDGPALLLVASVIGGVVWAILSGALVNRLMELVPDDDRPAHFALYNLALNAATFTGSLAGPLLAGVVGLREAIFVVFVLRLAGALALARWG